MGNVSLKLVENTRTSIPQSPSLPNAIREIIRLSRCRNTRLIPQHVILSFPFFVRALPFEVRAEMNSHTATGVSSTSREADRFSMTSQDSFDNPLRHAATAPQAQVPRKQA